ncbi:MAG: FAD/NAD(P)-binding protein [Pseudonocardiales bacterium]|nr:FAD/NAD(P)-binding protein [Pseudonocardiales bacterium]MBV9030586.1 FAD/NAD(P)-binding protein [Pseudonocardiales bacterium]MBW0010321.1 FAD/NAD(P)-binding protein [Pseudonocardiales bacterium]
MEPLFEIGVVGGGPSAVCLLDSLAREKDIPPGGVVVFEPSRHLWRGRPYQPDIDVVRVNSTPDDMSIRAGDTDHFEDWLTARDLVVGYGSSHIDTLSGARFVPRAVFGDYLEQSARSALVQMINRGWRVRLVRERVDSADTTSRGIVTTTERGRRIAVDYLVLCVGSGEPADVYSLDGAPGFIAEPYPIRRTMESINPVADVSVVGSGLTSIDVVLGLASGHHRGQIRLLSRRGALPSVRQRPVPYDLRHFTPGRFRTAAARGESVTLAELTAIMKAELADAGESMDIVRAEIEAVEREDPVTRLRRQLAEVDTPRMGLRILQRAVPDAGPDVWSLLADGERATLLELYERTLMSLCCPMPPCNAATILSLIDSGQLEIVPRVRDVRRRDGGGFIVTADRGAHVADYVINAVNARSRKIPTMAAPLIESLVAAGVAVSHPRGGVYVERSTSRLTIEGRPNDRVYALGDPAAGSLFFTFGVQSLVDRAVDVTAALRDHVAASAHHRIQSLPVTAAVR